MSFLAVQCNSRRLKVDPLTGGRCPRGLNDTAKYSLVTGEQTIIYPGNGCRRLGRKLEPVK